MTVITTATDPASNNNTMGASTTQNGASSHNNNGAATAALANAENGPHTLHLNVLDLIQPYRPPGPPLMYADDEDWQQPEADFDADADVPMDGSTAPDGDAASSSSTRKHAFGKRMPIDREEVVRLMLQGLHDMGYR
jgi:hypothetical protein